MALTAVSASAQKKQTIELPSWLSNVKLSGYGMTQYQYSGQKDAESNSFNIRMARIALEGRIAGDFYWKTQIQFNGNTSNLGSSPRMVDLFAEWQKYDYFKVKIVSSRTHSPLRIRCTLSTRASWDILRT